LERGPSHETTHRRRLGILVYEIGFAAETGWKAIKEWKKGDEPIDPPPFDYVAELLDSRIQQICNTVLATEPCTIYLTGAGNFREEIAKRKGYKANRKENNKPFHYANIPAYLKNKYDVVVVDGMEADDAMCIQQCDAALEPGDMRYDWNTTIICTRDKDLRQCPGWHFGWELGNQPQFGPLFVKGFGDIQYNPEKKTLKGTGDKFFYAQLIMGDPVDNVPGIPSIGPKGAFDILEDIYSKEDAEKAVIEAYRAYYGESWKEELIEQGRLLYMIREVDQDGKPIMWNLLND